EIDVVQGLKTSKEQSAGDQQRDRNSNLQDDQRVQPASPKTGVAPLRPLADQRRQFARFHPSQSRQERTEDNDDHRQQEDEEQSGAIHTNVVQQARQRESLQRVQCHQNGDYRERQ